MLEKLRGFISSRETKDRVELAKIRKHDILMLLQHPGWKIIVEELTKSYKSALIDLKDHESAEARATLKAIDQIGSRITNVINVGAEVEKEILEQQNIVLTHRV